MMLLRELIKKLGKLDYRATVKIDYPNPDDDSKFYCELIEYNANTVDRDDCDPFHWTYVYEIGPPLPKCMYDERRAERDRIYLIERPEMVRKNLELHKKYLELRKEIKRRKEENNLNKFNFNLNKIIQDVEINYLPREGFYLYVLMGKNVPKSRKGWCFTSKNLLNRHEIFEEVKKMGITYETLE